MSDQQKLVSYRRRQVLIGLLGVAMTGCSFGNTGNTSNPSSTSQNVTPQITTPTATPAPTSAWGATLVVYKSLGTQIQDLVWSPDSKYIATGMSQGTQVSAIRIVDATTGQELDQIFNGWPPLAWSPDGKMLASADLPGSSKVIIASAQTGQALTSFQSTNATIYQLTWSPDTSRLAVAGSEGVEIWNATTGKKVLSYPTSASKLIQPSLVVAWSPDGEIIASAAAKNGHSLQFWNARSGQPLYYFPGTSPTVAVWSPDGKKIATGSTRGQSPRVLDSNTGQVLLATQAQLPLLPGLGQTAVRGALPHAISWSPDNKYIAFADVQNQVQVWHVASKSHIYTYTKHSGPVLAVGWSPSGSYIASSSNDNTMRVWQAL